MATRKTAFQRFRDSLTAEQHALLKQSSQEAESERSEMIADLRRYEANMAPVNLEIRNAFRMLMALRATDKISLADLADRTDIAKERLVALVNDPKADLSLEMLANIAKALGTEIRISVGRTPETAKPRRRRKTVTA